MIINNLKKNKKNKIWKIIIKYLKKNIILYIAAIIMTIISSIISIIMPKIINDFLNSYKNFEWKNIINLTYILISLQLISGIFIYLRNLIGNLIGIKIEIEYRNKIINHLLYLDISYHENQKTGNTLTKLINDTNIIGENMQAIPLIILSSFITFFGSIYIIFSLNWQLSLIVLGIVLLILILSIINVKIIHFLNYKWRKVYTEINANIIDRLNNISLIKSNATENIEKKRFFNEQLKYYKAAKKTIHFDSFTRAMLITLLTGINIIGLISGFLFVSKKLINIQTLIAFLLAVNTLIFPVIQSIQFLSNWAKTSTSIIRINEILNIKSKIIYKNENILKNQNIENIIFKNVKFRYHKKNDWILNNFSFNFKKGKSYAIVGATGAGKTTISKLLLRYYDPVEGKILINNNNNLCNINLIEYLNHIGYIEQNPQILFGTFIENISYTKPNANFTEIKIAAKKANLHNYIIKLPNGYNTILGENGINLSGGQKQRIAIARIFLKNPELIILDEATSSLDNIIEKKIQNELNKLMINRTSIIIAHRLSTIQNVDKILVLEKNKGLIQVGTFNELKIKKGYFKNLYEANIID